VINADKSKPFLSLLAREPFGVSDIQNETFQQVLKRLQKNYVKKYIVWENVL
jgi:hypothetical protein